MNPWLAFQGVDPEARIGSNQERVVGRVPSVIYNTLSVTLLPVTCPVQSLQGCATFKTPIRILPGP